jgi:hypothetical protein
MLRLEVRNASVPIEKKPSWIKTTARMGPQYTELRNLVKNEDLHTVCQEAGCPNIFECWEDREATFLIGGERASILSTLEPTTSVIVGILVFHEAVSLRTVAGSVLVILASLLIAVFDMKNSKEEMN